MLTASTDFAGGTNFILIAILTLAFSGHHNARQIVASLFLILWATRLAGFLLFRILKTGKDDRFDDKRDKFFPFLGFFVFQMLWCWTVSLPVTLINSPNITQYPQPKFGTGSDIAGVIIFAIGFLMEAIADVQKYRFKANSSDKGAVCDVGFFAFSRHPNYAGEILVQFSIYMTCVSPAATDNVHGGARAALYASIVGALFLTVLLMFVSGLPLQERPGAKKRYESGNNWEGYKAWLDRTSMLIPFPPQLYARMPVWIKRTLFLEFPIYVFDPAKHADMGKVRERESEEGRGEVDGERS